jgi:hypothetical protein
MEMTVMVGMACGMSLSYGLLPANLFTELRDPSPQANKPPNLLANLARSLQTKVSSISISRYHDSFAWHFRQAVLCFLEQNATGPRGPVAPFTSRRLDFVLCQE